MSAVVDFLIGILGYVMRFCYFLLGNYGLSIILFTLLTKFILFPVNLLTQKTSIKMVQMQPELDALKIKYIDDKDKYADEQLALYKKYKYNPFLGVVPLMIQIPIVLGLVGVVYRPLSYVMGISSGNVSVLKDWLENTLGVTDAGNLYQLKIFSRLHDGAAAPAGLGSGVLDKIMSFDMHFLGFDLSETPSFKDNSDLLLIPVIAGLSALLLCFAQNKINVLQLSTGKANKIFTTLFMVSFSTYFAFLVPAGVGLYWIFGNLFGILSMMVTNLVIPPKKYIDFDYLNKMKAQKKAKEEEHAKYIKRERADYKRFFAVENMKLMFYSEQNGFYKYFAGMIHYICENSDLDIQYVTSDPNDKIFEDKREQIHPYYVASDKFLIPLFMKLDCDMCVMTMPDLEKYHIKRSKVRSDVEYVYISHGMGSNNRTMRKGSLDWYDTVFCVGPSAVNEIRQTEELYHTKVKTVVEAGYPLLDDMLRSFEAEGSRENKPPKILVAPSWQPDNILENGIEELLDTLKEGDYEITLRPHPQAVRMYPEKFELMKEKYSGTNVIVQTDFSSTNTVFESDILITDWSGICWEFAFTTLRPVLFINTPMKIMNADYDKIAEPPMNIALRDVIGKSLDLDKISEVRKTADEFIENREAYRQKILETREKYIFNIGSSRKIYGRYVLKRLGAAKKK